MGTENNLDFRSAEFQDLIDNGYISFNKHNEFPLYIYNYTAKTQWEKKWNAYTLACRGIILDENKNIVARPFPKFFNYEEIDKSTIPNLPFEVHEKYDGSLGILYFWNGDPHIATRGSFHSEQAQRAMQMLYGKYNYLLDNLKPEYTYLFEIIYPENRIVVDYGDSDYLILIGQILTQPGRDIKPLYIGFSEPQKYFISGGFETITDELPYESDEGVVVRFENGFRFKIKYTEYKRLHKLVTQTNEVTIWQMLKKDWNALGWLDSRIPDEFYVWARETIIDLKTRFTEIETECRMVYSELETRKATAEYFKKQKYPAVLFCMLDNKEHKEVIWKLIKPEAKHINGDEWILQNSLN